MEEFERIKRLQQRLEQETSEQHQEQGQRQQDGQQQEKRQQPEEQQQDEHAPWQSGVKIGIGDDAAVLAPHPDDTVVTTDAMVQGVHFLPETMSWYDIGYKCLAASVSDVAAMGGRPTGAVMSLAVPREMQFASLEEIYDGIGDLARQVGCPVIGGDLVSTVGPLVITSTVLGRVPQDAALLRSGARFGDIIYVTGEIGGSAAGLALLQNGGSLSVGEQEQLRRFHQRPLPQVEAGQILRECGASSCNDISDGLASECNEIAEASGVRLRLEAGRIPIPMAVVNYARTNGTNALDYALYGGEDYQLVGTASPMAFAAAIARCESVGIRLTAIGRVELGSGVIADTPEGRIEVIEPKGYNHFAD